MHGRRSAGQGRAGTMAKRGRPGRKPEHPPPLDIETLFQVHHQTYKGWNVLAGKALYLALFDRRTGRRLHVMGRTMKKCGHKNWGGGGQR